MALTLEARPVLSYAMAHNGIPVISRLVIEGVTADAAGARLCLDVSDARGMIASPEEVVVDLRAGHPTVLTDLTLTLDPAAMLQVEEQRPGAIRARLLVDGEVRAESVVRTRVLAAHQWLATPTALALEMLAAHVMPNHPAITVLMGEVAEQLARSTSSPSLEGYQAGPERVELIVAAVYAAMQARGIRYAEPPASWADDGQKVRTPEEVLDGRVGTCLDTVVVMAAALEQAGIRPLIWVVDGHAFLGYWREETTLGAAVESDIAGVVNRVDLHQMGLVETTALTRRAEPVPFGEAQRLPRAQHLTGDLDHAIGVLDIHQARMDAIVPLPARTRGYDGQVVITSYTPPAATTPSAATPASDPGRTAPGRSAEPTRITRWKNALLDLSLRNRLINFTPRSALALSVPDGRLGHLEDLLHRGTAVTLRPSDDLAAVDRARGIRHGFDLPDSQLVEMLMGKRTVHVDVTEAAYASRLRSLAYKARTIQEETGANNLYLALGSLTWNLDGRGLRSPLILVPVTLASGGRGGGRYRISLDEAGSSTPNYCLIEKLRQSHGMTVPGLADPVVDDAGIDLDAAFDATRRAIAEHRLPFRVEPTADLAILQFAKFRLWKDLDENWPTFARNPLVSHLIHTPTEAFADPVAETLVHDLDLLDEQCPVPADASQLRAIAEATAGRTFVLEGPPGTGKSQTITNLLAHAVSAGRRVLFVAEKRAALDVVRSRLDAVGMGPLSLDLHDKGSKPAAVREQIARALEHVVHPDLQDHAIRTEELRAARRGLTRYTFALHDRNTAGLSLYEARNAELAIGTDVQAMHVPELLLTNSSKVAVEHLRQLFSTLPDQADAARPEPDHPWAFVDSAVAVDVPAAVAAARRLDAVMTALPASLGPALVAVRTAADLHVLADVVEFGLPLQVLDESRTSRWNSAVSGVMEEIAQFAASPHPGLDAVTPDVLALPIREIDADARAAAASGFFGRRKRLAAVCERLKPVAQPGAVIKPKRLTELTAALVTLEKNVRALADKVIRIPGLWLPAGWTPFSDEGRRELDRRIELVRRTGRLVDPANPDPDRGRFAGPLRAVVGTPADIRPVREAAVAVQELLRACDVLPSAVTAWAGDAGLLNQWHATAAARGGAEDSLRRWLDLLSHLEPLRTYGLDNARAGALTGTLRPDDARRSFELGLSRASVSERLRAGQLDTFEPRLHERAIARFVTASGNVRRHLSTVVPQQVLTRRGFDPRATGGKVGQLQRQLTAKRGGMKVRELMSSFGDVITQALPCVLVSPDSLARFFPAVDGLFDIVVFDEASQVRVADAVGAMGRARSVVVVGDSKQMPPTSFAESSVAGDDATDGVEEVVEDEESILTECVQARVLRHRLTWHYRSQDEALIAFSNHHYYDGSLSSFPAPAREGTGISLIRVDGHFHRSGSRATLRTNPAEAEAVVAEIRRRFTESPDRAPSIGVVTFNQQQRTYIEGLLRDADDQRLLDALEDPDGLFVKNLENVQGDERDVVLFSTAFSVNDKGVLPLNFGPLNRAGGERRLNVAVTRARRQVLVFSSFEPEQLRTEETSSVGLRHLRTYLEMAARGPSVLPRATRQSRPVDRHREEIAARLRTRGIPVRTDVGLSEFAIDLVLGEPDDPCVAVLLDGLPWSRRLTARDRDALPREVLADVLGWPRVERIWLPEWLTNPDAVVVRLLEALAHARRPSPPTQPPVTAPQPPDPVPVPPGDGSLPNLEPQVDGHLGRIASAGAPVGTPGRAWGGSPRVDMSWPAGEMFVAWTMRPLGSVEVLDALPAPRAASWVAAALEEIVVAEGPIHADRLARLVANGFGLRRVAESRKDAILRHLPRGLRQDSTEPVVWPPDRAPEEWTGYRGSADATERPLEHIPLREIANAMAAITRASAGMVRGELHTEVLSTFGLRRRTAGAIERLDTALELGVRTGRLQLDGDLVLAVRPELRFPDGRA